MTFQPHVLAAAVAFPIEDVGTFSDGVRDRVTDSSIDKRFDSWLRVSLLEVGGRSGRGIED